MLDVCQREDLRIAESHLQLTPSLPGLLHAAVQLAELRKQTACRHLFGPPWQSAGHCVMPLSLALPSESQDDAEYLLLQSLMAPT